LATEYEVIGPVAKEDKFVFAPLADVSQLRLDYDTTLLPPKRWFLPNEERLLQFDLVDESVTSEGIVAPPRVLFGLHACDVHALQLLDKVFLTGTVDPYYEARRAATVVIGVSCTPDGECFCNAFDADEVHRGFDMFLTDIGDRYYVSLGSVRGAEILDRYVETSQVSAEDVAEFQRVSRVFEESFTLDVDATQLPVLMDAKYDDPIWDEFGEKCLSCGACSMVCPTCYCFDVVDRISPDGKSGERVRTWDSCQFRDFAAVAHGQNFRGTRASRVRYRYYHKQLGHLTKYKRVLCVGCGRCARACPTGITPAAVIGALQKGAVQ
jgi:ferredoxin